MKRILSVLLILTMTLSLVVLAACDNADGEATAEATASPTDRTEGLAVAIVSSLEDKDIKASTDAWAKEMEDAGYETTVQSADGSGSTYVKLIEDSVADDASLLLIEAGDEEGVADAVKNARDAGVIVTMLGTKPADYEVDGGVYINYYYVGSGAVQLALNWLEDESGLNATVLNPAAIAVQTYAETVNGQNYTDGVLETLDADTTVYGDYTESFEGEEDAGYTFAGNALSANMNIRIFICFNADTALGVLDYLEDNDLVLSDYCIISAGQNDSLEDTVKQAEENSDGTAGAADDASTTGTAGAADDASAPSAHIGYIVIGKNGNWSVSVGEAAATVCLELLYENVEAPYWYYETIQSVTTWAGDNVFTMLSEDMKKAEARAAESTDSPRTTQDVESTDSPQATQSADVTNAPSPT